MRKHRTMVLAAGLLLTAAAPVFAQAAIEELGGWRVISHSTTKFE